MVEQGSSLLAAEKVIFGYTKEPLLYDLSLQVQADEMVGLLGPNGSGKTTLMRLLSGALQPRSGQILLEGRKLRQWRRREIARRVAVVPQELHVPFAFSTEQMVMFGRTPYQRFFQSPGERDRQIVQEAMEAAGVASLAEAVFNELSGGERQRVTIAMALAQQPRVLLLDEPTSHLDIKYQIETLELVRRLNRERDLTVIAAMHDLNLAARYFSRLLLFQRGIVADGPPTEVLEPGLLRRVYGINVQVGIMRGSEHISVLPPNQQASQEESSMGDHPRVHVLAGGGSGEMTMRALADAHLAFTSGVLNIGDSDLTLALRLASEVITEQPYAPISRAACERLHILLERSAIILLCPMPIGPGNLVLLQEALVAAQRGKQVILLTDISSQTICGHEEEAIFDQNDGWQTGMAARDYTGGEGIKLCAQLLNQGALVAQSVGEAIEILKPYAILSE